MALAGFQPYFVVPGSASISFSRNGLGVSKAAVAKLCNSKFVRILIDKPGKRLAIQVCKENDPMATPFSNLNQTILNMTGWTFDEKKQCYKVEGTCVEDEDGPALIFDLKDAQIQD